MESIREDQEELNWMELQLPSSIHKPNLEIRKGRDILIAIDHGPNSKQAFDWALVHFCKLGDTIHLVHAVSSMRSQIVYEATQGLMEKLAIQAMRIAMVKTVARITEGDPGKAICKEVERLCPVAVIMGTRGRSLIQSVLQGSVSEYCFHNSSAPVIIVPAKVTNVS